MEAPTIVQDMSQHFGAGVAVSLGDYLLYRAAYSRRKEEVIEANQRCLESIIRVIEAEKSAAGGATVMATDSLQYAENIRTIREHLEEHDVIKPKFTERLSKIGRDLVNEERVNNLGWWGTLATATVLEFGYDSILWASHYSNVHGESPLGNFSRNLYQIPAFLVGLYVGRGVRFAIEMGLSRTERKQERLIKDAVRETTILDIVTKYLPSETVQEQLRARGPGGVARSLAGSVTAGAERLTGGLAARRRRKAEEAAASAEAVRKRFEELTKGH